MSVGTGEVLDTVVLSKICVTCEKNRRTKTDEEFQTWLFQHKESGNCHQNFEGPSTSMETEAAIIIWSRSVTMHNMHHVNVLSYGDNKTHSSLNELQPYGDDVTIEKLDCVNHVHKRLGTGFRSLLKSSPHVKGGKGGLTKD